MVGRLVAILYSEPTMPRRTKGKPTEQIIAHDDPPGKSLASMEKAHASQPCFTRRRGLTVELRCRKEATVVKVDLYLAEMQMERNVEERVANAEQARLARLAKGPREPRRWRLPLASAVQNLKHLLMQQHLLHRKGIST
jgi:propanediol dehydratase large subunit